LIKIKGLYETGDVKHNPNQMKAKQRT